MNIAELLLDTAVADRELLQRNREQYDNPEISRDLDFVLNAKTEERTSWSVTSSSTMVTVARVSSR